MHPILLHPVFGLGEDWNIGIVKKSHKSWNNCIQSSGWVRIGTCFVRESTLKDGELHPVFGLGEDWNQSSKHKIVKLMAIASSLRAG